MVSDEIVDSLFFVKFHRSGSAIIFSFSTIMEHVSYPSKKLLIKQKTSSRWWVLLWKDYGWFLVELSIINYSWNFTGPDLQKFSIFELSQSMLVTIKKAPNQAMIYQDVIKTLIVILEWLWMVSDSIVDSLFFVKFHRSGPAKIFNFWTIMENITYSSKKLLIKQKTSSRWWLFFWKDYGWFLMKLSILYFSSNFTGPERQEFSVFKYHGACELSINKAPNKEKTSSRWWVLLLKDYGWFLIELSNLDFSWNFTGPDLQ